MTLMASIRNGGEVLRTFDVYCAAAFAVIGYAFHKPGFEPVPLILGFGSPDGHDLSADHQEKT